MVKYLGLIFGALALAALFVGCRGENEDLLERGEHLILEARWEEAIPALRAHLLRNPRDPGAHFYLGRAYLFYPLPLLVHAEGEFKTALYLFHKQGGESPIERFDDTYFELACHLELSKVYLSVILMLMDAGGPEAQLEQALEDCEDNLEAARRIDSDSPDVEQLETHLNELREVIEDGVPSEPAPPSAPLEQPRPPREPPEPRQPPEPFPGDRFAI